MGYAQRESRRFWAWMRACKFGERLKYGCLILWYPPLRRKVGKRFWRWLVVGRQ